MAASVRRSIFAAAVVALGLPLAGCGGLPVPQTQLIRPDNASVEVGDPKDPKLKVRNLAIVVPALANDERPADTPPAHGHAPAGHGEKAGAGHQPGGHGAPAGAADTTVQTGALVMAIANTSDSDDVLTEVRVDRVNEAAISGGSLPVAAGSLALVGQEGQPSVALSGLRGVHRGDILGVVLRFQNAGEARVNVFVHDASGDYATVQLAPGGQADVARPVPGQQAKPATGQRPAPTGATQPAEHAGHPAPVEAGQPAPAVSPQGRNVPAARQR